MTEMVALQVTKRLSSSQLSRQELKQVWAIADEKRQGFLAFVFAVKLISFAQEHELTPDILKTEVDWENIKPPVMEGLDALTAEIMSSATKGLEVK
ncbi:EH domain-containing protein 2-like [Prunus persica]|uniref:EH domain-containing protein 2-like n=1 Tax=Prunus persica TaxID=3760 RepID=UPI0009AB336E|nr:EH domain-containing protein 2-like [Prunus persica]XP_020418850.1 EH domain-containing protein 2-like [Prunus persica]